MNTIKTLLWGMALVLGSAPRLHAQFSIPWSTTSGGGGQAAGGIFSLNGTIGQYDAGTPLSGGVFSVSGGYWTGVESVPPDRPPTLAIRLGRRPAGSTPSSCPGLIPPRATCWNRPPT